MGEGKIIRYAASAGSGKTHALTREYLAKLLNNPFIYRRILAVTFTNKAAAEMKYRILEELADIASGKKTAILEEIRKAGLLKGTIDQSGIAHQGKQILYNILSDYSRFSIGTIDSFFQKIFRAFAREIGVQSNFNLHIKYDEILKQAITELINNIDSKKRLRGWLVKYAYAQLDDGKAVKIEKAIYDISRSLFSEEYKLLSQTTRDKLSDLSSLEEIIDDITKSIASFRSNLKNMATASVALLDKHGVPDVSHANGVRAGLGSYLRALASGEEKEPGKTVRRNIEEERWFASKGDNTQLDRALADGFGESAKRVIEFYQEGIEEHNALLLVMKNIYLAAILGDVHGSVRSRNNVDNSFVLADTGDFLRQVIGKDQTPFIYEKTGNEFDVFMIDEFQDTSKIQYDNFRPLLENSISEGNDCLVVGDIKQSIYRWRNGDWSIFGKRIEESFPERVETVSLSTNWRSLPEIVEFNNSMFRYLPEILDEKLADYSPKDKFIDVYKGFHQNASSGGTGGYVRFENIESSFKEDIGKSVEEMTLERLPTLIKICQDDGFHASDIGILVRKKSEGTKIISYLSGYYDKLGEEDKQRYNFNILSADSLLVGNSDTVRFIVASMIRICDRSNMLNRAEMLSYYYLAKETGKGGEKISLLSLEEEEERVYPDGFHTFLGQLVSNPLFEVGEAIISFFGLNAGNNDLAAINFFQDQVLEYMNTHGSDLNGFTEWWKEFGFEGRIVLSGEQSALRVMTIHKAKGLQFKVVIIPFLSWSFEPRNRLLWVEPVHKSLSQLGALPVEYGKRMEGTEFAQYYVEEKWANYLDNLNLIYVAFTRAKERLYGFIQSGDRSSAGTLFQEALLRQGKKMDEFYEQGTLLKNQEEHKEEHFMDVSYPVYLGEGRLRLRLSGGNHLKDMVSDEPSKVCYGTVLHEILSRIRVADDINEAVEGAANEGLIPFDSVDGMVDKLNTMISDERVSAWFAKGIEVLTEPEILTGYGDVKRPDRVVVSGEKATVIDYKFGSERERDKQQVLEYSRLIGAMGYEKLESFLWYVEKNRIVKV